MKVLLIALMIFVGFSCGKNGANQADVLPAPQMTKVMWDIMQVDEYATNTLANDSARDMKKTRVELYQQVFDLHHINQKQFSASFKYYSSRPDLMKTMFDSLSLRGERERKNVYLHADTTRADITRLDTTRRDSIRVDTTHRDTTRAGTKRRDTIRAGTKRRDIIRAGSTRK